MSKQKPIKPKQSQVPLKGEFENFSESSNTRTLDIVDTIKPPPRQTPRKKGAKP